MAQFDFYPFEDGYLLDVQSALMDRLNTRMIVPLLPIGRAPKPAERLNPVFTIGAARYVMVTQFMGAVPVAELKEKAGSLAHEHFVIKSAIDMVFDGV
ncbi:CcdB family protein [Magnetospirillum sp. 64-120]|uniref:CcdB family protein n=1 Tax=Magnetospirillum sp. 64-120 TaxID=1895778 RepID=UPI00092B34BF|nr:CcdB family protein [Magnetospirillum sp. 64-120]OJX79546.1 MAG: plasmid maintenance protein CcdB [Magnetospirillum sp. 64-120]